MGQIYYQNNIISNPRFLLLSTPFSLPLSEIQQTRKTIEYHVTQREISIFAILTAAVDPKLLKFLLVIPRNLPGHSRKRCINLFWTVYSSDIKHRIASVVQFCLARRSLTFKLPPKVNKDVRSSVIPQPPGWWHSGNLATHRYVQIRTFSSSLQYVDQHLAPC